MYALFPSEPPPKGERPGVLELDDDVGVVQLYCLVLARRAWSTNSGEQALRERICVGEALASAIRQSRRLFAARRTIHLDLVLVSWQPSLGVVRDALRID